MELWIADIFDRRYEVPYIVGVYDSEEAAWEGIRIVTNQAAEKNPGDNMDSRFEPFVTPVQLNGFTPACMDWLGNE